MQPPPPPAPPVVAIVRPVTAEEQRTIHIGNDLAELYARYAERTIRDGVRNEPLEKKLRRAMEDFMRSADLAGKPDKHSCPGR